MAKLSNFSSICLSGKLKKIIVDTRRVLDFQTDFDGNLLYVIRAITLQVLATNNGCIYSILGLMNDLYNLSMAEGGV